MFVSPVSLFYSYAHEDEELWKELEKHLSGLRRQGLITEWHDHKILAGTDRERAIDAHLSTAAVILLLVSPDFLASDYCYGVEMQRALQRQENHEVYVIPVLLRSVDLQDTPLEKLQCLPMDGRPVTTWANQDEAFSQVARGIRKAIDQVQCSHGTEQLPSLPPWDLSPASQPGRIFMAEDLPVDFVARPHEFATLKRCTLNERRDWPTVITAALRGAGGYGKTTIAKALCHDERIQQAFDDGILWVTLGENPGNLVGKVEDVIYTLSHERPGFTSLDAAAAHLAELLTERDMLLVIDDVWNAAHLKPFMQGGKRCARLITTRNEEVLPVKTDSIQVDAMRPSEAVQLLTAGLDAMTLSASDRLALRKLVARLGEWALLLKLANGRLRRQVSRGQPLPNALLHLNKALDKYGLVAFDAENAQERH